MYGLNFLAAEGVAKWISDSFPIIRLVLMIIMVLLSVFMIFAVLTQESVNEGLGAISGNTDTFFGKNKGSTREGTMKRLTVITAISLVSVAILFFVSLIIYSGK